MLASVLAGSCLLANATRTRAAVSPWEAAVQQRADFEAQPSHTRADYTQALDSFRAIYHANPGDAHAAAAVEQVAQLLAEQGHEYNDEKSLHDAAAQYAFLERAYPQSSYAERARRDHLQQPAEDTAAGGTRPLPAHAVPPARDAALKPVPALSSETTYARREPAPPAESVHPAADSVAEDQQTGPLALVSGVRHWSTPSYTRVVIDLGNDVTGNDVTYQAARVEHPDRIFFDLHHARLAPELAGKSFAVTDDGFLMRIRAAQFTGDVVRVVLDVHEVTEYSAFLLPNPSRLIIDIHGRQNIAHATEQASNSAQPVDAQHPDQAPAAQSGEAARRVAGGSSSLPPMPVTDGSSGFGLPSRSERAGVTPQQRVVIPTHATSTHPVPNTTTQHMPQTSTDVAAVSSQPGKVEATHRPTSSPIVQTALFARSHTDDADAPPSPSRHRVKGTPTAPPPPEADGETSLMRALGLKIGRIVIDPGHGGHDSGTLGVGGIEEKDVVLDVALRLGKLLHDRLGAEVVYTRADDTFIPLETRTAIANKAQADLFISVHANSSQDPDARGVEVYYLNFTSDPEATRVASRENAVSTQSVHELSDLVRKIALKDKIDESRELATDVDDSLYAGLAKGNEGLKNRGIKKAPFVVLIGANMPSILAEISFVTNPVDAAELRTPGYRERVAESLYAGIARYASTINGGAATRPTQAIAGSGSRHSSGN
jgi:N-acetylmuramoyl-L-alanine amidase